MPEAEPAVAGLRSRHDPSAGWGVPAHVTVLYPFLHAELIDPAVMAKLAALFAATPAFGCSFAGMGRFAGVAYLDPVPDLPFRALTDAVHAAWPDHPPYGGEFADVVPHLTVAQTDDESVLEAVAAAVLPALPISADVAGVELWTECTDGLWRGVKTFPLAG